MPDLHVRYPAVDDQWPRYLAEREEEIWGDSDPPLGTLTGVREDRRVSVGLGWLIAIGISGKEYLALEAERRHIKFVIDAYGDGTEPPIVAPVVQAEPNGVVVGFGDRTNTMRIMDVLRAGPATAAAICQRTGLRKPQVTPRLYQLRKNGKTSMTNGVWSAS